MLNCTIFRGMSWVSFSYFYFDRNLWHSQPFVFSLHMRVAKTVP